MHLPRRADEPTYPYADEAVYPIDERFQPEAGEPAGRAGAPLRGLQLHLDALRIRMTPAMKAGIARKPWTCGICLPLESFDFPGLDCLD